MTLKRILSVYTSIAFSLIFGLSAVAIYVFFASYRREEFKERLMEKAETTAKLLSDVKKEDQQLLKLIDQKSINSFYNEKTLIFDNSYSLIYSSVDDASIKWNVADLKMLKSTHWFYTIQQEKDVLGLYYPFKNQEYYILIAAEDKYGNQKQEALLYTLLVTYLTAIGLVWLLSYQMMKRLLKPLDNFQKKISHFNVQELNKRLPELKENNEINELTKTFNQLLARVDRAFELQRDFTSHASHELRTPISRMILRIDNLQSEPKLSENTRNYLSSIAADLNQMSDLISSLLLLARYNEANWELALETTRIDELIFSAYERLRQQSPQFQLNFEVLPNEDDDYVLEVKAQKSTLEIAFTNLLRNACLYADDCRATVRIKQIGSDRLQVELSNTGDPIGEIETQNLFQPFARGQNAKNINGSGLGLRIAKRILDFHQASITYIAQEGSIHCFQISFPI